MIMAKDINKELDKMEKYVKDAMLVLADTYYTLDDYRHSIDSKTVSGGYITPTDAITLETEIKEGINYHTEMAENHGIKLDPREKNIWSDILKRFE